MAPFVRGLLGLGITLFVVGSTMGVVNGMVRGWAIKQLYYNPGDPNALALLALF